MLEMSKRGSLALKRDVVDEMFCFMGLSIHLQSELRGEVSDTISCTDVSPSGGGSAIATRFKKKSLVVPEELPVRQVCGCCGTVFSRMDSERRVYCCARRCALSHCVGANSMPPSLGRGLAAHATPLQRLAGWLESRFRSPWIGWCRGLMGRTDR